MSVLIGITTKNRHEVLPNAIHSALAQQFSQLHVAVFDDNSSDNTPSLKEQFPTVHWETSTQTRGLVYGRNKLMREARTKYFCSLDDDAWFVTPDVICTAVNYLNKHNNVAAVAFDILSPDSADMRNRAKPFETANFIGCGHILRLSAVQEVGYYDTYPFLYGSEEKDLCIKFLDKGYQIMYMPGVHVWHDKINLARDEKGKYLSLVCNDLVFIYRRAPFIFLIPGLLLKISRHLKFSASYKNGLLFLSGIKGIGKFLGQFFNLQRMPISYVAFLKFYRLNKSASRETLKDRAIYANDSEPE